jgi:cytochrome c peroxidase
MSPKMESSNGRNGMLRSSERSIVVRATRAAASLAAVALVVAASDAAPQAIPRERLPAELSHLTAEEVARIARMSPLPAVPADPTNRWADDEAAAELGHHLFFDTRISPKGVSCATCHEPARFFTDGRALAQGVGTARRNAPTVVDSARRRWVGWDGKFDSLWSQALSPIEHPDEMGSDRATFVRVVRDDAALRARYERVFGAFPADLARTAASDPLESSAERNAAVAQSLDAATVHLLKALGAYQRKLLSAEAPIDRFVAALRTADGGAGRASPDSAAAEITALDASAMRGLATFVSRGGCFQCHRGASFTDEEFHTLGLVGANGRVADDPARLAAIDFLQANPFNAAGPHSDAPASPKAAMVRGLRRSGELFGQFRTPPLRGVAETAPYMHDGRFESLEAVVRFYDTLEGSNPVGHHGEMVLEPLELGDGGRADLVAFLRALSPRPPRMGDPAARWWWPPKDLADAAKGPRPPPATGAAP